MFFVLCVVCVLLSFSFSLTPTMSSLRGQDLDQVLTNLTSQLSILETDLDHSLDRDQRLLILQEMLRVKSEVLKTLELDLEKLVRTNANFLVALEVHASSTRH